MPIDYSPLFRQTPQSGMSRGLTHLSSVLDAIMERDQRAAQHKAQLEQAARIAAEDDARQRAQLDQTIAHQTEEERIARERMEQEGRDKTASRALQALPHFQGALAEGDTAAAEQWAGPGGIGFRRRPETPAMDMLGAIRPQEAPMDPLGPQPPGAGEGEDDLFPEAPPMTPLDAQLRALPPKTPKYDVTLPGGQTSEYDPTAARSRRMERGGQTAQDLGGVQSPSPFHAQALAEVQSQARAGGLKSADEAAKVYRETVRHLEDQANSLRKTAMLAAAKPEQPSGVVYDPTTGQPIANAPFKKDAGDINKTMKAALDFDKIVRALRDSYAKGRVLPKSAEAQRRKALVAQAGLAIKNNEDLGALVGGDWRIINDQVGEGESWMYLTDPTPSIDQALESSAGKLSTFLGSKGLPGGRLAPQVLGGKKAAPAADAITDELLGEP